MTSPTTTAAPHAALHSIDVHVHIREFDFVLPCHGGQQRIRWVAFHAARRYAQHHGHAFGTRELVPVCVRDAVGRTLFPDAPVRSVVQMQDVTKRGSLTQELKSASGGRVVDMFVEVLEPGQGRDSDELREVGLWERFAYVAQDEWVSVRFTFDTHGEKHEQGPMVKGNFNNWEGELMELRADDPSVLAKQQLDAEMTAAVLAGRTYVGREDDAEGGEEEVEEAGEVVPRFYELRALIPAYSEIVFRFEFNGKDVVVPAYDAVRSPSGARMNYFLVKPPPADYSSLREQEEEFDFALEPGQEAGNKTVSARVVGAFEQVHGFEEDMLKELFENDWEYLQFADVVRRKSDRESVKAVLWRHFGELRTIFQYFSSHGEGDITYMSVMEFLHFCHVCKIPSRRVNVTTLDRIFRRVNIEEVFDEEMIEANPDSYRNAMRIVPDPFNPDNQFLRGEFLEALVRIAIKKWPKIYVVPALERLIERHVLAHALNVASDQVRDKLVAPSVQKVYNRYAKKLHNVFVRTAALDRSDMDTTSINTKEFEMLLTGYNLLDSTTSRRAAFQAFAMSQEATLVDAENYELVYPEFLECLGRIAIVRYVGKQNEDVDSEEAVVLDKKDVPVAEALQALLEEMFGA